MEKAFVGYVARHSIESTVTLRAIRFVGWTMLVARHLLHARQAVSARPSAVLIVALWLATSVEGKLSSDYSDISCPISAIEMLPKAVLWQQRPVT